MTDRHVLHWDEVDPMEVDSAPFRWRRRRLGVAAGAVQAGLSLWQLLPGGRSTPPHVHSDEEEIFYVLRGSGVSWQDGKTYRVGSGDCLVHRCGGEAHTLIAGDQGLDVLMFAEGSRTSLTYMPRTQMMWAASHWVPLDAEHPFMVDAKAGPLDVPEPEDERPGNIVAAADVPEVRRDRDGVHRARRDLGTAGGSVTTGLQHLRIDPGADGSTFHCHSAEEELFVVLAGGGAVRVGEERIAVCAGSVVARPAGTGVAHAFSAGDEGLELLAWGQRRPHDARYYPDAGEVALPGLGVRVPVQPSS